MRSHTQPGEEGPLGTLHTVVLPVLILKAKVVPGRRAGPSPPPGPPSEWVIFNPLRPCKES